jgi:hypothetical protein
MYVLVHKDINETKYKLKTSINTLVRSSVSRMVLKNKHFHGNIFDEVSSIMSQQPYALIDFFQFGIQ